MGFDKEKDFESALIAVLQTKGWETEVIKNPSEKDLIENWKNILFNNNRERDRLNDFPLTDTEMQQILDQIRELKTPLKLNGFINGKTISIKRDNPDDTEHLGKEISLDIYDRDEIAAGKSKYQIAEQPRFEAEDPIGYSRRGDIMLLINGMPVIHIELKRSGVSVSEATTQIKKYSYEGKFSGLYSLIQVFVAMTPEETVYFANPGEYTKFNSDFYFHWEDFNNEIINDWKTIASTLLSIPMAHQLIGFYTVADDGDGTLKVMRSYQYYAANAISDKVAKADFNEERVLGGYIWHTTGSGKTMTSFKSAELIANSQDADKVVFLMDRIELGVQSLREYRGFADCADDIQATENTDVLKTKLKSSNASDTLIVTSIQKMSRIKDDGLSGADIDIINKKRLVFIVDECHRDVFGDMMVTIKQTFPKAMMFGFTGTPLMGGERITSEVFGDELHRYSISDGIRDKNVLAFDPKSVQTFSPADLIQAIVMKQTNSSSIDEVFNDPKKAELYNRLSELPMERDVFDEDWNITGHGLEHYIPKTQYQTEKHRRAVTDNILKNIKIISRNNKFSGILATSSIPEAIEYYRILKDEITSKSLDLKISCLFDPNIDNTDGFEVKEEGLKEIISDYNEQYGMTYSLPTYAELKKDIVARFAHKKPYQLIKEDEKINLLIVVDQLLTGFDSKWINVLYLDKVLQGANIIQAFSRTNRICDKDKPFGIIKYYRYPFSMDKYIEKAVAEYSGNKPYGVFVDKLKDNVIKLNSLYKEIKDLFESCGITEFETLPEDKVDRKKFGQLYAEFVKTYRSAQIQGLKNNDSFETLVDVSTDANSTEHDKKDDGEDIIESLLCDVDLDFDLETFEKIKQRAKDLDGGSRTENDDFPFDIDTDITEYDRAKIDSDYLNKKFKKYLVNLTQENISQEELEKSLSDLHKAFAFLSANQQKFANIFIHDIQSGRVTINPEKTFMDYIAEYEARDKNDRINSLSTSLGLDSDLLRKMVDLNLDNNNIDEYGRFEQLKSTVDKERAKSYLEQRLGRQLLMIEVNIEIDKLLRNFIIKGVI